MAEELDREPKKRGLVIGNLPGKNSSSTVIPPSDDVDSPVNNEDQQSSRDSAVTKYPTTKNNKTAQEALDSKAATTKFSNHTYPQTPAGAEQPHSVVFRIKIREQSKAGQAITGENPENVVYDPNSNNRLNNDQIGNLAGGVGFIAGGGLAAAQGDTGFSKTVLGVAGGTAGYLGGKALGDSFAKNRLVKTNSLITLHIPQAPSVAYSAQWQDQDLGALTGVLAKGAMNTMDVLTSGAGAEYAARTLGALASIPKEFGVDLDVSGAIQAASGKVSNPNKEQLFKSMNFRSFTFDYKFAPRSQDEFNQVNEIIKLFKKNMHSEKDASGLFLIYPSEFDIEFRYNGTANQWLHRVKSCALSDMRLSFGNGDTFTAFSGTGGAPSEIGMSLVFKELEILTADDIEQGY